MRRFPLALVLIVAALPALAQTPEPSPPPTDDEKPAAFNQRVFFGGAVGAAFGTVDYVELAPMVGFRIAPRFEMGVQPFYRWTDDHRYSPSFSTTDYGATIFGRVRIWQGLFGEGDYQYTSYEYQNAGGGSTRDTNNAFLAGAGYAFPVAQHVAFYASALYDFTYSSSDLHYPYDSPVRYSVGVSVGF